MVRADVPDRVLAVLDWELGAVGDPRADIGYLLATYSDASSHRTALELSPVTALPGFPTRGELLEWYAAESGSECGSLAWFEAFALWKGAIFCEEIYTRHLRTDIGENPFAAGLEAGVARLAAAAILIAGT
jgi:aminoglycoside phosphotransferase (APT) family kinase protein